MLERVYTANQVADILGVCPTTVYRYVRDRKLPIVRVGRLVRIPETAIVDLLHRDGDRTQTDASPVPPEREVTI